MAVLYNKWHLSSVLVHVFNLSTQGDTETGGSLWIQCKPCYQVRSRLANIIREALSRSWWKQMQIPKPNIRQKSGNSKQKGGGTVWARWGSLPFVFSFLPNWYVHLPKWTKCHFHSFILRKFYLSAKSVPHLLDCC